MMEANLKKGGKRNTANYYKLFLFSDSLIWCKITKKQKWDLRGEIPLESLRITDIHNEGFLFGQC